MCFSNTLALQCTRTNTRRTLFVLFLVVGSLVVKASVSRAEDPGFDSRSRRGDFSVVSLQGARSYRVNAGTGWPGASIL